MWKLTLKAFLIHVQYVENVTDQGMFSECICQGTIEIKNKIQRDQTTNKCFYTSKKSVILIKDWYFILHISVISLLTKTFISRLKGDFKFYPFTL